MLARINKRSILELLETTLVWKHGSFAGRKKKIPARLIKLFPDRNMTAKYKMLLVYIISVTELCVLSGNNPTILCIHCYCSRISETAIISGTVVFTL